MQSFNFDLRHSAAHSMDGNRSRYAPSSIYSNRTGPGPASIYSNGPGPAEESLMTPTALFAYSGVNGGSQEHPRYNTPHGNHPRASSSLNLNDPVAVHLLAETAIGDSKQYEVLSYEQVELLKRDRAFMQSRLDATRRKLALESKLRDAAQSLNRLYSTRDPQRNAEGGPPSPRKQRRSFLGSKRDSNDAMTRADSEYAASQRKVEELTLELAGQERKLEEVNRRILEHTAGILQMTHRGLKKNIRKSELPRSPDSMTSQNRATDRADDFDERSLYQVPDYVQEFGRVPKSLANGHGQRDSPTLNKLTARIAELNSRLHGMILQAGAQEHFDPPPGTDDRGMTQSLASQLQSHLGYLSQGLNAIEAAQARSVAESQNSMFDSQDQIEEVNDRLHDMLERTNSVSHSPMLPLEEPRGKDMQSQLQFSGEVLDRLHRRIEALVQQKDILTTQVQQQRDLNSKSDAQRDAQIRALMEELSETKRQRNLGEREAQSSRDQMNLLMEQIEGLKHESQLQEQQRGMNVNDALEAERESKRQFEERLLADLKQKQDQNLQLQTEMAQLQTNFDLYSQEHVKHINDLNEASQQKDVELQKHQADLAQLTTQLSSVQIDHQKQLGQSQTQVSSLEAAKAVVESNHNRTQEDLHNLEAEIVRLQTELTIAKADLDGAYGSRAQRAADVSSGLQKEIRQLEGRNTELQQQLAILSSEHETKGNSELQNKIVALQRELKDTIEDYEVMTKASIEFEKERDHLEATIDTLRDRCESLEVQLNEERLKWLGVKASAPAETTSTMVLKNEFKKMMRDTRSESVKALRAEQDERRRLEGVLRSMKKEMSRISTPAQTPAQTPAIMNEVPDLPMEQQ